MRTVKHSAACINLATAFGIMILIAGHATATTASYTFSQGGWTDAAGDTGNLTGSFSGTPEANGNLQLADLSSFEADFHESGPKGTNTFVFSLGTINDFLYDAGIGLLNFSAGSAASNIQLCSGPDTGSVCLGINPNSGAATALNGFFDDLPTFGQTGTRLGATVTFAGSTSPAGSATPEPGTVGLLALGGTAFLGVGILRRRSCVALVK
jgi:hypothetical protein